MKKKGLLALIICLLFTAYNLNAQVKPSAKNLHHQWDFEEGDANDLVGYADGVLKNDASIAGGILQLTSEEAQGGYVQIPGDLIEVDTFPELSAEVWATANVAEPNYMNMLLYFGSSQGSLGFNYLFYTPARRWQENDPEARVGVSIGTWDSEDGITYTALDDETLHHHVITWKDSLATLYVDGESVATAVLDSAETKYYEIGTTLISDSAFIGKGGYSDDPTWKGTVELVALWSKALDPEEIQWLYEAGEKRDRIVDNIKTMNGMEGINIYAVNRHLYIRNIPADIKDMSVTIYSITGAVVYHENNLRDGVYLNLKDGMYLVKIQNKHDHVVKKIVLQ